MKDKKFHPNKMEKPPEQRERLNGQVCTFILSIGTLNNFDRKKHICSRQEDSHKEDQGTAY